MSLHKDQQWAESFGSDAERYDRTRPSYPAQLVEWLTGDSPGLAVDVGCGTGRVCELLLAAGWHVRGVEPDERMAAVARRKGIDVEIARFEEWVPSVTADLVCSGHAWHWLDPVVGCAKAAEVLRPGGRLALFWTAYQYAPEVAAVIEDVYRHHARELIVDGSVVLGTADLGHRDRDSAAISNCEHLGEPELVVFKHRRTQTVEQWLDELPTHTGHRRLGPELSERVLNELAELLPSGETLEVRYETKLTTTTTKC